MRFQYEQSGISEEDIFETAKSLESYQKTLFNIVEGRNYETPEASLLLPDDQAMRESLEEAHQQLYSESLKYIVVVGIGGSNLGMRALRDALYIYRCRSCGDEYPKMVFVDTVDSNSVNDSLSCLEKNIKDPEEILIVSITKSGGTTETIANTDVVIGAVEGYLGKNVTNRVVVISGDDSPFTKAAKSLGIKTLDVPNNVGGRFSVLSNVGLLPSMALGIDVDALLTGARDMRDECLRRLDTTNPALVSAIVLYKHSQNGKNIHTSFFFNKELESLGKWYRQLLAESIGKEKDIEGKDVRTGITPDVSIGSTDLHSVAQLYVGGPFDKVTTFVHARKTRSDLPIPGDGYFSDLIPDIKGKSLVDIMSAIYKGTTAAYQKNNMPYMEVTLDDIGAYEVGQFMQFKMLEIMYLGHLLNIDAFNQPNVESYKIETKKFLEQ